MTGAIEEGKEESRQVVAMAGSLRRGSINGALLRAAKELAPPGLKVEIVSLRSLPFYDGDVEAEGVPPAVAELRRKVETADGLLLATPEYNHGIPAVLKNAVDWLSRPPRPQSLDGKPVAILGATPGSFGTRAAQYQLRQCLTPLNALVMPQPQMLVRGASGLFEEEVEEEGPRLTDEATRKRLAAFLEAFRVWISRFV